MAVGVLSLRAAAAALVTASRLRSSRLRLAASAASWSPPADNALIRQMRKVVNVITHSYVRAPRNVSDPNDFQFIRNQGFPARAQKHRD